MAFKVMSSWIKNYAGLILGLIVFFIILLLPQSSIPGIAQKMAAVAVLMTIWWVTEAIPIPATSLLPIFLYPLLKIMKTGAVTLNYGHHLVFLFLGGFIIALAIERWNLHKRIALYIICIIGNNPRKIILGFMLATALLSMWISNTATTMMMLPIALAIISQISPNKTSEKFTRQKGNLGKSLMLAIAYSASIGGITTLIGTPPNLVFVGILKSNFPGAPDISFIQWMLFALPFAIIFLPIAWFYLVYIAFPIKIEDKNLEQKTLIKQEIVKLGHISQQELKILIIFIVTALLWIFRADINLGSFRIPGWSGFFGLTEFVNDSTVAIIMAILTFIIPAGKNESSKSQFLMDWTCVKKIPWGILLLFGGGFALADGFQQSGLTEWLGIQLSALRDCPPLVIIAAICVITTFTTEFTSNTAMATTLLPIIAGLAVALELNPLILMLPATISSSTAFMLPVATPPNAIIFGSGLIQIKDMARIGFFMNIIGLILVILLLYLNMTNIFEISWYEMPLWAK
jgi:sodium-dependent dicarboxylate transporter 2/3/5